MSSVLIRNATVLTMNDRMEVVNGSVSVRDGRIASVGAEDSSPHDVTIDAATGVVRWQSGEGGARRPSPRFISPALPDEDRLYLSGDEGFFALRK